jgi:hypothetical protein
MNGRVYDPVIARFMTPDPQIQLPTNLQSYNRYSYAFNNPLRGSDPTGFGFFDFIGDIFDAIGDVIGGIADAVGNVVEAVFDNPVRTIGAIAVAYFTGYFDWSMIGGAAGGGIFGGGGIINAAAGGFAGGLVSSGGDFKAGLQGAITAGAFSWAGATFTDPFQQVAAHAVIGCASAEMSGGSCGAGAVSAGFSKLATQQLDGFRDMSDLGKGIAVTVIGGTASVLAGGKFENGAVTAAFGYLFNQMSDTRGRGPNLRHEQGVRQAISEYEDLGFNIVSRGEVTVNVPGFDSARRYDFLVQDPDNKVYIGIEVKTTMRETIGFKLPQVDKDIMVVASGGVASKLGLTVRGVGYSTYCFGCDAIDFRSTKLYNTLKGAGIPVQRGNLPGIYVP